jgi:hypothetical protein
MNLAKISLTTVASDCDCDYTFWVQKFHQVFEAKKEQNYFFDSNTWHWTA